MLGSSREARDEMRVRLYKAGDLAILRRMHAGQGFEYPFPEVDDPLFVSKLIVEDDAGVPVMAGLARVTCETYLLMDSSVGTPSERYARLAALDRLGAADLRARGFQDAHAWLPPSIARKFGKRLGELGWIRDDAWTPYCRRLC